MKRISILASTLLTLLIAFCVFPNKSFAFSGTGSGSVGDPYQITTCLQLQEMTDEASANYILSNDIDCSATTGWNAGAGFEPVVAFTGSLDGNNNVISNLFINRDPDFLVGLFTVLQAAAEVTDLGLEDVDILGGEHVGVVAGENHGSIINSYSTGNVEGTIDDIGGLVGENDGGIISQSHSSVDVVALAVTGNGDLGGLVGQNQNDGEVNNSYATGTIESDGNAGGLIGQNVATVTNSYATGTVTGDSTMGGLIGSNGSTVVNSYATGAVTGVDTLGGLVGFNTGSITNTYASGAVTGDNTLGGLVGFNFSQVTDSFSIGLITGNSDLGGLIGVNFSTAEDSFWDTQTSGQSSSGDGIGKTTAEMKTLATFVDAGWDIEETNEDLNDGYPYFAWQAGDSSPVWYIFDGVVPTPTPQPGSSSTLGGGSTNSLPMCTSATPVGSPNLFKVITQKKAATLQFVPVSGENTGYVISYGVTPSASQYAVSFNYTNQGGAVPYTINYLYPGKWYFKVAGMNTCTPGSWSQTVPATIR